ncbi:MAG: hypothetical protein GF372_13415 [Candidatus Marinimicrobia bacterium]|nr:hypothetical protein [Candidatus Neomarinimicrobiota bacterium]
MNNYRINFRNVQMGNVPDVDFVEAPDPNNALQEFVNRRRSEKWSYRDIFERSIFMIIQEESNKKFSMDNYNRFTKSFSPISLS